MGSLLTISFFGDVVESDAFAVAVNFVEEFDADADTPLDGPGAAEHPSSIFVLESDLIRVKERPFVDETLVEDETGPLRSLVSITSILTTGVPAADP